MLQASLATPDWKRKLSWECLLSDYFNLLLDVNLNELTSSLRWTENNHCGRKERRLILQYHSSRTGLGNFSSGNVIDSEAGFAFPFLPSITIISSVILGLFIYQATITKKLRTRGLNATKHHSVSLCMQRDCWFSHTWLSVCTCVEKRQ